MSKQCALIPLITTCGCISLCYFTSSYSVLMIFICLSHNAWNQESEIQTNKKMCDVASSFVTTCRENSCHTMTVDSPGSSTTTQEWTPAGSWTGWWWPTWTGPICVSISPATTGWVGRRLTTCLSGTCWAAWTPWTSQNVGHSRTNTKQTQRFTKVKIK